MRKGQNSICWDCGKACGGCSWSDHNEHRPVSGWTAERTSIKGDKGARVESFLVIECPEFEQDRRSGKNGHELRGLRKDTGGHVA